MNVGVLGHGARASVDASGLVSCGNLSLEWMVGADDRWHVPADEPRTHQQRIGPAPVFETFVRAPGGDVVERVYAAAVPAGAVAVVDVENRSPVPLTVALVVRIAGAGRVAVVGSVLRIDGRPALVLSRPPGAWAAGESTAAIVMRGDARTGPIESLVAPAELALLFPVPHRTSVRVALGDVGDVGDAGAEATPVNVRDLPNPDAVARGWERQLERGLQTQLPSPVGDLVDAARADLLLAARRDPAVVAALEDWAFDDEAVAAWARLGWRARRAARRRVVATDSWAAVRAADAAAQPERFLSALRAALVREEPGSIDVLPGFPPDWLGQSITVDSLPLRAGTLSFAVRWHGARPALLWDAPAGVELRAPALDAAWSSREAAGEVLLAEPPAALLAMGTQERSAGEPVEAPGQFT